jgi:hypothetical protein
MNKYNHEIEEEQSIIPIVRGSRHVGVTQQLMDGRTRVETTWLYWSFQFRAARFLVCRTHSQITMSMNIFNEEVYKIVSLSTVRLPDALISRQPRRRQKMPVCLPLSVLSLSATSSRARWAPKG